MYLVAIINWYSWYVLSWEIFNTLDVSFCLEALKLGAVNLTSGDI